MSSSRFLDAVKKQAPLQVVGAINAYSAMLAERAGHQALYLSGAGVANASYGLPDLGMTNLNDVLLDARRITGVTDLPLLVDIDTGWGHAFNIQRAIKEMIKAGVAAVHIEDQVLAKRCGHRPNKAIIPQSEMVDRIKSAVDAKTTHDFAIMARTDAFASEGMQSAIDRANACVEAGADMLFPEAIESLADYKTFCDAVNVPVLANITEFGKTPLFTVEELKGVGVEIVLYPLTAFRMMSHAAIKAYEAVKQSGTQKNCLDEMQTRDELYDVLNYHQYEQTIDKLNEGTKHD
jgi:methylisocitrate lyase